MAKKKTYPKPQDFAAPMSILLFKEDDRHLRLLAKKIGMQKSVMVRLAVRHAMTNKLFEDMAVS